MHRNERQTLSLVLSTECYAKALTSVLKMGPKQPCCMLNMINLTRCSKNGVYSTMESFASIISKCSS